MLVVPVDFVNGTVLVKPVGEVDLTTVPMLRAVLDEVIWTGPSRVVVDLAGVAFLAVAGARCLAEAEAELRSRHGRLFAVNTTPLARQVLAMVRFGGCSPARTTIAGK